MKESNSLIIYVFYMLALDYDLWPFNIFVYQIALYAFIQWCFPCIYFTLVRQMMPLYSSSSHCFAPALKQFGHLEYETE